jgi:hypothetical protein
LPGWEDTVVWKGLGELVERAGMLLVVDAVQGVSGIHHDAAAPEEEGTSVEEAGEGVVEGLSTLCSCGCQCVADGLKLRCKVRPAGVVGSRGVSLLQWRLGGEGGKREADGVDPRGAGGATPISPDAR